jgi:hypothetical protein
MVIYLSIYISNYLSSISNVSIYIYIYHSIYHSIYLSLYLIPYRTLSSIPHVSIVPLLYTLQNVQCILVIAACLARIGSIFLIVTLTEQEHLPNYACIEFRCLFSMIFIFNSIFNSIHIYISLYL